MIPEGKTLEDVKKASNDAFCSCPGMREGGLRSSSVMLCGRGLCTTHIHRPHTAYIPAAKIDIFSETAIEF